QGGRNGGENPAATGGGGGGRTPGVRLRSLLIKPRAPNGIRRLRPEVIPILIPPGALDIGRAAGILVARPVSSAPGLHAPLTASVNHSFLLSSRLPVPLGRWRFYLKTGLCAGWPGSHYGGL